MPCMDRVDVVKYDKTEATKQTHTYTRNKADMNYTTKNKLYKFQY